MSFGIFDIFAREKKPGLEPRSSSAPSSITSAVGQEMLLWRFLVGAGASKSPRAAPQPSLVASPYGTSLEGPSPTPAPGR